jgi:hypothetical protein
MKNVVSKKIMPIEKVVVLRKRLGQRAEIRQKPHTFFGVFRTQYLPSWLPRHYQGTDKDASTSWGEDTGNFEVALSS